MKERSRLKQEFKSEETSFNACSKKELVQARAFLGNVNIDIGGGSYDKTTDLLFEMGIKNHVYDPYNRGNGENRRTLEMVNRIGGFDSAVCAKVLNVIKEREIVDAVVKLCYDCVKPEAFALFIIYRGDSSGIGRENRYGWQRNQEESAYIPFIEKYFDIALVRQYLIIGKKPKGDKFVDIDVDKILNMYD